MDLLEAPPIAEIDPEPFYIYNFPGSMDLAALFRPGIKIEDGLVKSLDMPANIFYCHEPANLVLFLGKEPNLRWREFGDCVLELARRVGVRRVLFVGSFGGTVPHTREPRLFVTCSDARTAAGDGALRPAPHRLRRPRLVHQLPDDPRRRRPTWR